MSNIMPNMKVSASRPLADPSLARRALQVVDAKAGLGMGHTVKMRVSASWSVTVQLPRWSGVIWRALLASSMSLRQRSSSARTCGLRSLCICQNVSDAI